MLHVRDAGCRTERSFGPRVALAFLMTYKRAFNTVSVSVIRPQFRFNP